MQQCKSDVCSFQPHTKGRQVHEINPNFKLQQYKYAGVWWRWGAGGGGEGREVGWKIGLNNVWGLISTFLRVCVCASVLACTRVRTIVCTRAQWPHT